MSKHSVKPRDQNWKIDKLDYIKIENMLGSVEKMKRTKTRPKAYAVRPGCVISGDSLNLGQFL